MLKGTHNIKTANKICRLPCKHSERKEKWCQMRVCSRVAPDNKTRAQILLIDLMITLTYNALKTALLFKERNQNEVIYTIKPIFCWSPELMEQQQFLGPNHSLQPYWKHVYVTLLNSSFTFLQCLCNELYTIIPYNSVQNVSLTFKIESLGSIKQELPSKYSNARATPDKSVGRHTMTWNLLTLNSTNALLR